VSLRHRTLAAALAAFVALVAGAALTMHLHGAGAHSALGLPRSAPPRPTTGGGVRAHVDGGRGTAIGPNGSASLEPAGTSGGAWQNYEHGSSRTTSFGRELVQLSAGGFEELTTVERHQGIRTWSWDLKSLNLSPKVMPDGSVALLAGDRPSGLSIAPVSILDQTGRDVTPAGARWTLARGARGNELKLKLDDRSLPLPYTIDPGVGGVTFSGNPQSAGFASTWTVGFTTGNPANSALAAGDTITVVFNAAFAVPATPTVVLQTGFTNCSGAGATVGTTVTITLANSGGTCALPKSTAATLQLSSITNPAAGSYTATTFSVATSKDTAGNPSSAVVISAPSSVSAPAFTGTPQSGGARSSWAVAFNSSASGALSAGSTISVVFPGTFSVPASPTITLTGSYTNCSAAGVGSGTTVTITLSNNGGACTHAASSSGNLSIKFLTNPGAGSIAASNWSVATSTDATPANPSGAVTIAAATSTTAPTFTGSPQTGGARSTWTVGFTSSATGALTTGDTITVVFPATFTVPASPTITLTGSYTNCSATGVGSGTTVTITLSDNAGTCTHANSTSGSLTIKFLTNPGAGSISATSWSVKTSTDTVAVNPASSVTINAATAPSAVSFSGAPQTGAAHSTWTVGFTTSASGALAAGDTITAVFNSGFTVPASPTVTLTSGFTNCSAVASGSGQTATITLSDNAGTCSVSNSAAATLKLAVLTNPAAGSLLNTTFTVATSRDTATASPASNVVIAAATSVTGAAFSATTRAASTSANWSVDFTTSATGALAAGDTLTVVFPAGFTVPATPTITLPVGFANCTGAGSGSGTTVTITLSNNAGTCALAASAAGEVTIAGLTNPSAGTYVASGFSVKTATDASAANPASSIDIFGSATQVVFTTQPGGGTAGTSWSTQPVLTVEDSGSRKVANYGSNVTVAIKAGTGAAGAALSGTTTVAATNGVATFSGLSIDKASTTYQLHATSGALTAADSSTFTISAASAQTIALNGGNAQSATVNTNVATAPSVLVTDAYGNPVSGVSVTFAVTGGGGSVTGGSQSTNSSGIATVGSWKLGTTSGSSNNTLSASSTGLTGSPVGFTASATPGSASTLTVSAPAGATAGTAFGVTVTALDAYGNTASGYTGTVHFTGGGTGATLLSDYAFVGGDNGVHTFTNGVSLTQAGSRTVTATDTVTGTITGTSGTIAVAAAGVASLSVSAPASATAGSAFSVTVTALDSYGNTATTYTGTVHFTGGGTGAALPTDYTFTGGDTGTHTFSNAVTLTQAGSRTVTATDTVSGSITGTSSAISVSAAGASTLSVSAPASATAGTAFSVSVTAIDAYGNTATGYTGTVHFTGGGTSPTLPSNYTFTGGDSGTHTFTNGVTFTQAGSRTVTSTDTVTGSITGTSSSVSVSPAGASTLSVAAPASATAGAAFSVTVTALDAYGNTATGYAGTVHFTGGGTSPTLPSNYTFTGGDNGAHTFTNGVTLTQAGSRTVTATDTVTGSITGTSSSIPVSAAGASTLSVAAPASATAGSAFSVTVTALDAYGNTVTGYTGTVHFTGGGASPTLPPNYTFVGGDSGVHTFTNGVTLTQAGSRTVTATDTVTGSITGTSSTISVSPAGASTLSVTAPASATAGSALSVTVTALDAYGNTATGYTGTVHFTGGGTSPTLPSNYTFTGGDNGTHTFTNGVTLTQAGSRTLTLTDTVTGSINGTSGTISVSPAGASTLTVSAPASATAGTAFSVSVTALDAYGNTATGYTGTVHFTGGGTSPTLPSNYTFTGGDNGVHTFTNAVTLTQAGSRTVTATDTVTGSITGTSSTISVSAAGASTLSVISPASATAGSAFSVTVTALDAYGNTATGYTGTIHFTGGGTSPTLPSDYTFNAGDNGVHTFGNAVMLTQAGNRTVTATDTVTGSITGTSGTISVSPAGAATLAVTTPPSVAAGAAFSATVTAVDPYGNTAAGYTGTVHFTGGGTGATLPSDYTFVGGDNGVHTFTNGVTLTLAGSRTITTTDTVTGTITGTSSTITVSASATQLEVSSPASATAGSAFSVTVTAKDSFGNVAVGYTGTVHFTGGGAGAALPTDYTFNAADKGTHTFTSGATLTQAGNRTITATDTVIGTITGTSSTIAVSPAGGSTLTVTAPASATAGTAFSTTVTALDAYGNTATGYTGTAHFTGGGTSPTLPSDYTFTGGDLGVHTFTNGVSLTQAGSRTLTATDTVTGSITGTSGTINVSPTGASTLIVTAPASATAGSSFSATVTARDPYGNTATGYTGTVHFTGGGTSPTLPSDYTFTGGDNGTHTLTNAVTLTQAGNRTLSATDTGTGSITGTSSTIAVGAASAHTIAIQAGNGQSATVGTAVATAPAALVTDQYGNPVAGVSVAFASATGGGSVTGGSQTTNASGIATAGSWTLGTTTGANTFTATSAGLTGSPLTYTATATADVAASFTLAAATTSNDVAGTADDLTITVHDQYGNVATGFGGSHDLTFAGGTTIGGHQPTVSDVLGVLQPFGTATTLTFVAGTASVNAGANGSLTLYKAESASITATDSVDSISTAGPLGVGVVNAAAHTIAVQAGDGQSATVGNAVATAPSALVTDQYGNPVAGTSVTFAAATGGGSVTGGSQVSNASGIAAASSWTLGTTTGADTLTASSSGLTGSPLTYTATATPDTAAALTVTAPANATAGSAFSVTVSAKDQYGNTATAYTGTVHFTGGGTGAALPTDYTFNAADNGTHTFTNSVTLTAAGSRTITATDTVTSSITGTSGAIALAPASASTPTVSAPGTSTAGSAFSATVTAFDQYGNQATGYTGTVHFTGGGTSPTLPSDYTFVGGDNGTHTFTNGVTLTAAGSRTVTATDTNTGSITGTSGTISVSPAGASTLTVTTPGSTTAGSAFSAIVTALDAYGNTATGYTGTVHFTGGGASPTLPSDYTFTGGDLGVHTFSNAVVLTQAGGRTLTATDTVTGSITGTSGTISVSPAGASTLTVTAPASATAGTAFSVTVTALDAYGNTATGYTGTVHFTGGGTGAALPTDYTFNGADNGTHTFTNAVTLTQAGSRTLTATDMVTGSITGTSGIVTVSAAGASTLTVSAPPSATAGSPFSATVNAKDAYGNTATGYTGTVHFTGGGTSPTLPSDYTFTGGDNGTHAFTNAVSLTQAGNRTLTATDTTTGSITGSSGTIAVSAGSLDATVSTVGSSPGTVTADGSTTSTITVTATDPYGNAIAGVTTSLSQGTGNSSISPASTSTNGTGIATFTVKDTTAETVTYQATVASTLLTQTANVQFAPGAADGGNTTINAAPTSMPADGSSTSAITVHAKDAQGNTLTSSGGVVTLSTDHGSLSSVTDNHDGSYTATLTASASIETATVTGTIDGNAISAGATVSFTGVPSKYLVTSSDYAPAASSGVTITAQLADQDDNPTGVAGKTITWSKTGPGGSFSSPTSVTNASGIATVTFTTGPSAPATYTVTATDDTTPSNLTGTSPAISTSVGGVSAPDSTIGAAPASVPADGSTTSTITVTLTDALGNPIAGKTVTLTQPGGASSSISSASGPSDSSGHVTFTVSNVKGETVAYTATDTTDSITLTHTASVTFADSVPPTIAAASPADGATGAGTVILAGSGVDDPGSGIASVDFFYCDSTASACTPTSGTSITGSDAGGGNWTAALDTTSLVDGHGYSWVARAADNAGNHADTAVRTLNVDNSKPSLTLGTPIPGTSPGSQYYDSASKTLWLNSSDSGSFQLAANASDAQSGVSDVRFAALLGTGVTNDTTSPYQSAAYNFAPGSNSGTVNVTAFNGATVGTGGSTKADAFTIAADTVAPGAFVLGAPADSSKIGTGVTVSAAPSDGQAGLRQVAFYYCDLSGGPCVPSIQIGLTQTVPVVGVYAVNWDTTGLTDGHSYAVDAVATDDVGHTTSSTPSTVTVDNSAPAVSVAAPAAVTGGAYQSYDAANARLWLNANQTGSFKLRANASDADSGIASVTFPALLGTGPNTGTLNGGTYESSTYAFNNPSAPGSQTIAAANGVTNPAPKTSTDSIDVEVDGSTPTTIQTFPLDNGSYETGTWNGNCAPSGICGTVTDAGSGVAQVNVSIKDRTTGKYWGGTAFDQSAQTFNAASVAGNNWHYALAESDLTSPHAYLVEIDAVDNVGNTDVHQQFHFTFGSDTGGPSDTLSLTNATHAYLTASAPYVLYYDTSAGGGGFKLHASATDPSGVDTVAFPDLSGTSGFSGSGGTSANGSNADPYPIDSPAYSFAGSATTAPPAKNVDSADLRGNVSHDQVTFVLDNSAPTGGSLSVNSGNAYSTTTSFPVSHTDYTLDAGGSGVASSVLTVASTTLSNNACGTFGSPTPVSDGTFNGSDATCYRFALTGTDNVGNVATTTFDIKVDTTAPSQPAVTFGNLSSSNTYDGGAGTLYYRPSAGGTFRIDAASSDAESGVQGYAFSPLTGFASTSQSGGSLSATFNGSSTGNGAFTVHATNNASLDSSDTSYNVTADSTAPSGGSLTVNGTAATSVGTSSYLTSGGSVTVATTPYSDGGSGLASQVVMVQQASLSNDACGTYGGTTVVGGASYGVANGNCYLFSITATDNVGNVTTAHTTVKVDTTAPVAPGISFTGASAGNTFVSGSTLYYRPSVGGTFTVNATGASDPETGIAGYAFSTLSGFAGATQNGNHVDVTFDGSSTGGGAYTVVANNNAGVSSTPATPFSIAKDSTAPSGGLLSINPYSGSLSIAIAKTDFTDAGSGIASNAVTRSNPQTPVAGACPVGGYTGANAVTLPNDTVPADGECYQYTLTGTDNVGNAGAYSTNVLVDTTGPAGGSVAYANGASSLSAISIDWNAGTDAESGIAQVRVDRASASVTGGACGSLGGFSTIVTNATVSPVVDSAVSAGNCYAYRIVVTNNAGVSSTFTSASVTQLTAAVPFQIANTIPSGASLQGSTLYLGAAAANQPWKLQLTTDGGNGVTQATWQGKSGSPLSSAPITDATPTSVPFNSGVYTWDGTPVNDTIQLTRDPGAQVDLVRVVSDLVDPTGLITYANGAYASHSVHITTSASDADSGVASTQVQRASAPLTGATCGSWTGYADVTLNGGGNDTTVTDNTCYSYQLVVTDNVGNQFTATSPNVAEIPDITPPTFVSAATNIAGTQIAITMSELLDAAATTPASAFTVTYDGVAQPTPSGISISGSTVTLDLVNAPDNSQVVKVRFTQPSSAGDRMRDLAAPIENETASFGPVAVANNTSDTVAPSVTSASVDGATLALVFDEALAGAAPDPSAFTVTAGATGRAVTSVAMSGNDVTLTLASPVASADTVVAYAVPALNALHDATGNTTAPFTRAAANQTPVVAPPASGGGVVAQAAPELLSAAPDDGSTVRSVASISLDAGQAGTWTNMTVTRPDGTVVAIPDAWGSTATWPFANSAPGLYVVRGTLSGGGQSVDVLSHFTIWTPSSTAIAPPVEKNAAPNAAGELTSADGMTKVIWPAGAFDDEVVVDVAPRSAADFASLPKTARLVSVNAFLRSTHAKVTNLGDAIDICFENASPTAQPRTSEDGKTWLDVPQLQTLSLSSGQSDGWFRDSDGTVHVLARHLSYYALVGQQVSTALAVHLQTVRRLWLTNRSFIAVRFSVTLPARVTGNFVAADGTVVPGQTVKTPTRHAGVTILRIPLRVTKPGVYQLQLHAEGGGQAVDQTATIRFLSTKPSSPVWQAGAIRVAVIRGAGALEALGARLGGRFVVERIADADLYRVVDPASSTAAAAVVVDLSTVPPYTLAELHSLLPEVQIIGLGGSPAQAAYYRSMGISPLLPHGASAKQIAAAVRVAVR
jgi:hypothetical protein